MNMQLSTRATGRPVLRPTARTPLAAPRPAARAVRVASTATVENVPAWVNEDKAKRLNFLEANAMETLTRAASLPNPVFPCALIAGDVCILHLLHRLDLLKTGKVKVVFIDTFHLFPETLDFLKQVEAMFDFKAAVFHAAGFADKEEYRKTYGSDLYMVDIEKYDQVCKVEPFQRALKESNTGCMINGRRRDHGAERAHLQAFEVGKGPIGCQPLAFWEFEDCFDYLKKHGIPAHPLHDQGYPSIGDIHSTVPVPKEKWFEYAGERSGRFQGLTNPDGSPKTECGIHNRK